MIEAKKVPLVGHNCAYDLLYFFQQFIKPLPETYAEFKKEWNQRFP